MFFTIPDIIFMTYVMITLLQMMEEKVLAWDTTIHGIMFSWIY
jgi:hypothetical protein